MLYVPHWVMWKPEWDALVETFVRAGGTLVVGALTGTRDEHNHVIRDQAPGPGLSRLTGVRVSEFGRLAPPGGEGLFQRAGEPHGLYVPPSPAPAGSAERRYVFKLGNREFEAAHLYEALDIDGDVQAIGTWANRFLSGIPCVTSRPLGRGRAIYVGTYLTPALAGGLADMLFEHAGVEPLVERLPPGIEVSMREGHGRRLLFVQNTRETDASLVVPDGDDLITERPHAGMLDLHGYGCAVIRLRG